MAFEKLESNFSLSEKEREEIRKKAEQEGKDPELAVKAAEERMRQASAKSTLEKTEKIKEKGSEISEEEMEEGLEFIRNLKKEEKEE